jgi:hypothetical protein
VLLGQASAPHLTSPYHLAEGGGAGGGRSIRAILGYGCTLEFTPIPRRAASKVLLRASCYTNLSLAARHGHAGWVAGPFHSPLWRCSYTGQHSRMRRETCSCSRIFGWDVRT